MVTQFRFLVQTLSVFFVFVFGSLTAIAQKPGELLVKKDSLISLLQNFRVAKPGSSTDRSHSSSGNAVVDRGSGTRTTTTGFRVQIFLGSSRSEAYAEQSRFKRLYKDIEAYVAYAEPNYRVKVGDFRTRGEAQRLADGLKNQFSNVFIFTETIFIYQ